MKVYKYRSIDNKEIFKRDLETFQQNKFFAPTFDMLNDPFEANFNEVITITLNALSRAFSVDTENLKKNLQNTFNLKNKLGIFSLSKSWDIEQMWAYYASANKGYCIEYDVEKLKDKTRNFDFSTQIEIDYCDQKPTLGFEDIKNDSMLKKMFGTKKNKWQVEDETRLIFDNSSIKNHHESAMTGIYFGAQANNELIEIFKKKFTNRNLKFYQIVPNKDKNCFERDLIFESSKRLEYDISKYSFKILKYQDNQTIENYYIYLKDTLTTDAIKEFILAFREKFSYKPSNLNIFDSLDVVDIIDDYPLKDKDYIRYANTYIASIDFSSEDTIFEYPFKDSHYDELLTKI